MKDIPDYSKYNLGTLYTILRNIDRQKYPDRVATLVDTIKSFEADHPTSSKILGKQRRLSYSLLSGGREVRSKIKYIINEFSLLDLLSDNSNNEKFALLSDTERSELSKDPFAYLGRIQWTLKDVILGIGILSLFYTGLLYLIPKQFSNNPRTLFYSILSIWIINIIYLFFYPCFICKKRGHWPLFPPISLPVLKTEFAKSIKYYFVTALTIGIIIRVISIFIDPGKRSFGLVDLIEKNATTSSLFFFLSILCFTFIPIIEEVFFRGFLYNALKSRMPIVVAVILQSIVFTYGHPYNSLELIRIFLIGIAFAIIYEKRKNLLSPIFVHGIMNFSFFLLRSYIKS